MQSTLLTVSFSYHEAVETRFFSRTLSRKNVVTNIKIISLIFNLTVSLVVTASPLNRTTKGALFCGWAGRGTAAAQVQLFVKDILYILSAAGRSYNGNVSYQKALIFRGVRPVVNRQFDGDCLHSTFECICTEEKSR